MKGLIFVIFFGAMYLPLFSQEIVALDSIAEEDWTKFARVEILTGEFLEVKNKELKELIVKDARFGGGSRFNQIKSAWEDESKMESFFVTSDEKNAYSQTLDMMTTMRQSVIEYKTNLIQDETILGTAVYRQINELVKKDPTMKEKLDLLIVSLRAKERE